MAAPTSPSAGVTSSGPDHPVVVPGSQSYVLPVPRRFVTAVLPRPASRQVPGRPADPPSVLIHVPAGTGVRSVISGTVSAIVRTPACGLGVIVKGVDGATYEYCHAAKVTAKRHGKVSAGQKIMLAGASGTTSAPSPPAAAEVGFEIKVPDLKAPVCAEQALLAWSESVDVDVRSLPESSCGSKGPIAGAAKRVLLVESADTSKVSTGLEPLLRAEGVSLSRLDLGSPSKALPANWQNRVRAAVERTRPTMVIVALGQDMHGLAAVSGANVRSLLARLPVHQRMLWVEPANGQQIPPEPLHLTDLAAASSFGNPLKHPTQTKSKVHLSPVTKIVESTDRSLESAAKSDPGLRVMSVDQLMAQHSAWLDSTGNHTTSEGDQGLAGALFSYFSDSQRLTSNDSLTWATAFADQIGAPSLQAIRFVMAWATEEGAQTKANNPLNTTENEKGDSLLAGNTAGVKLYPTLSVGLDANLTAIEDNGSYQGIIGALQRGNIRRAATALQASPWCGGVLGCPGYGRHILLIATRYAGAQAFQAAATVKAGTSDLPGYAVPVVDRSFLPVERFLLAQLGKPYVWAGAGPSDYDCSGLVMMAFRRAGIFMIHNATVQYAETDSTRVHGGMSSLEPGDLVFFSYSPTDPASIHHVGVYVGNGLMIDAPHTGTDVQIQPVWSVGYFGATDPLALLP